MTIKTIELPMSTVMKSATLVVKVVGLRQFCLRLWFAKWCMVLAARIMGCDIEFQELDLLKGEA